MTAEEYRKSKEYPSNHWTKLTPTGISPNYKDIEAFAEAYHKAELERLVEEVDGVMVDITKGMYFDMVSAAAFRGILLKIAGIE